MKKIIFVTTIIILIPFLSVTFLVNKKIEKETSISLVTSQNIRVKRSNLDRIDTIPFEDYIVGVVAGEMPVSFEVEALKAQAVAARNYALKKIQENKEDYDVVDTTDNQVYLDTNQLKDSWKDNYEKNIEKVRTAISETKSEYLTYNDEIINLFYFSTSNGKTEDVENVFGEETPYLKSVDSPWDEKESSVFTDSKTFNLKEFYNLLDLEYSDNIEITDIKKSNSNRILTLKINGKEFKGREIYQKLKIRSTDFEIEQKDNNIIFKTTGFGHGVGMSQCGANGMAKEGYNYKDILTHYYQGTNLKKIENFENNV